MGGQQVCDLCVGELLEFDCTAKVHHLTQVPIMVIRPCDIHLLPFPPSCLARHFRKNRGG